MYSKLTDISTLEDDTFSIEEKVDDRTLSKSISDLSLSLDTRIKALNRYYEKEGADNTIETINKLAMMYELSGTKILREYLYNICEKSTVNSFLKSIAALTLCSHDGKDDMGYKAIDLVFPLMGPEIGTPYKISFIKLLMKNESYRQQARNHFIKVINDPDISCEYRYKAIIGLDTEAEYFIREASLDFLRNKNNLISCRILAGQNLLSGTLKITDEQKAEIENIVLSFAQDEKQEYGLRADAADVILHTGSEINRIEAEKIILSLGTTNTVLRTLYSNAQNVHTKEIEESVKETLEFLHNFEIAKYNGQFITVEYVEKKLMELQEKDGSNRTEKVKIALNRISMDRSLYSKYSCTLAHILLRVWTYMTGHEHEEAMQKRLLEELVDMAGTCSSGFASRLINTISGFGDFTIRISWRDQIISNLTGRLNARIRDMDDLTLQEKILNEMTLQTPSHEERKNFFRFFRKNMPEIRGEMWEEFRSHIPDESFDLWMRSAISMYETGDFT